jgi:glycosyltransferase involved in cell wall biosynthesis
MASAGSEHRSRASRVRSVVKMAGIASIPSAHAVSTSQPEGPADSAHPVRVLIVDTAIAFGGTLVVARNLLKHLDRKLIDASLVSACSDGFVSHGFAGQAETYSLAPRVSYVTLQNWKFAIRTRIHWASVRRAVELAAMATEFLANMPYVVRLAHLCRKHRVDVLHANNSAMEPLWAARLAGISIVSHLHGFVYTPMERSRRKSLQHVDAFVSISRAVTESAVRAGVDRARIYEIPNFVERAPEASPPPAPIEPAIGIFGRVTHWKGQKEFLRAAMRVLERFPRLRVYVVGNASDSDPRYFEECRDITRSSRFADQFEFTGRVSDVATYYRKCAVVVHTSIEPEPFGMVLIEAMAEARPVVASTLGAPPEIIQEGVEGYLVHPADCEALANRIITLLADPARAHQMGINGYRKVLAQFDPSAAAQRFERLYLEVVARRPKRAPDGAT